MGEAAEHDKTTIGFDGVRVTADDGAARSIALLVLAVALVALAAGLLLESGSEPAPATLEDETSQANGDVVPLSADRLVPPDLAPERLAIRLIDVPEPGSS